MFDARAAKLLLADQHLLVDGCPGLRLVAAQTRKTWVYRYKDHAGRMKQVRLGQWPAMALGQAVAAWGAERANKDAGQDPAAARRHAAQGQRAAADSGTVRDVLGLFADHLAAQRKPEGAARARRTLGRLLDAEPELATAAPHAITRAQAYGVLDRRRAYPQAAKQLRALLGQAWDWGQDAGQIQPGAPNWWRLLLRGQLRSKGKIVGGQHQGLRRRVLTRAELRVLLPWAHAHMSPSALDGLLLYLYTGMRGAEIFALRAEYVAREDDGWWITFPARLLKMERDADTVDHRVPLADHALAIVQRRMQDAWQGWLFFTGRGDVLRPYHRNTFSSYVYSLMPESAKARRRAGAGLVCPVVDWSPHALRRTARTLLSALDCPEDVGEAIIGHKPGVMVASYNLHSFDAQKRLWLARLGQLVDSLGGQPATAPAGAPGVQDVGTAAAAADLPGLPARP